MKLTRIKRTIYRALLYLLRLFPINKNKVLFCSYHGSSYSGNPKYIAEALANSSSCADIVWLASQELNLPKGMRSVSIKGLAALYEYATAQVWIDDSRKPVWLVKRKKQYYIQTWHASIGLKKAEGLALDTLPEEYIDSAKNDSKMANLFLSDSRWLTNNYREAYWYTGKILEKGLPREDVLYNDHRPYRKKLIEEYGFLENTHFVLYAPTFRNSGDLTCYDIDYQRMLNTLSIKTGFNWKIIVRLHPNIQDKQDLIKYDNNILNGSKYNDINELILASDLFISDYSSCIFDAAIAKVPSIIYASDIQEFTKNERGLFFSWDELPFNIARNNDELNIIINRLQRDECLLEVSNFLKKCGFVENNHASEDVAEIINKIIS